MIYVTKRQLDSVNAKIEEVKKSSLDEKKAQELIEKVILESDTKGE